MKARDKISRALNTRSVPSTNFVPGDLFYYQRYKVPVDRPAHEVVDVPRRRWYGPGRVLAVETKVTEHGTIRTPTRVVWIVPQKRLKKVHGSQLRHASETERDIANANTALTLPWTSATVVGLLEKGAYDDYTNEETRGRSAFGTRTPGRGRSRSRARSVPREASQGAL